jgi:formylglycine-generating enzyme required for sulfatase activity
MIVVAGVAVLGGTQWWHSTRALEEAKAEYQAALARFKESYEWEMPAHAVTLTKPYYLGRFEVTQEQYQQEMETNPSAVQGHDLPVESVSWNDAQEFCKKASERTGQMVRLPTEAEWEHACRAGTKTAYYTGDGEADLDRAGWYDKNSGGTTHPVGQKTPSAWRLYDMHGNVVEWCQDFYEPYKAEAAMDPGGPSQGQCRVLRGGSWFGPPRVCRSASRGRYTPEPRLSDFGFRVAADVPPKAP